MGLLDFMYKPKYRVMFLRREHKAIFLVKTKVFNDVKVLTKANGKQYQIDINSPSYIFKNLVCYFIDIDSGKQMSFIEVDRQMSPEELDLIVGSKIIKELTAGVIDNNKAKILWMIMGCILGLLLGIVIMQTVMAKKIEEVQKEGNDSVLPIPVISNWWGLRKCLF